MKSYNDLIIFPTDMLLWCFFIEGEKKPNIELFNVSV